MPNEVPTIMQRALALMEHHAKSEPEDSKYRLEVRPQCSVHPVRYTEHRATYAYEGHSLVVGVHWDTTNETYWTTCYMRTTQDTDNPELVLGVAGMLVKAGNLMRQLKALQ